MRLLLSAFAVLALTLCVATADERAPRRLSDTGLYAPGAVGVIAEGVRPFSPQYPLWTDGATKRRWVYLPAGATIGAADPASWDLPVGTRFWKEFAFDGRPVETRLIWRTSRDRWIYATYLWNEDGTDAHLVPEEGAPAVAEIAPNRWHAVPSVSDCGACHGTQRPGPLGFNALQLSPDRDPHAIHGEPLEPGMVTLATLAAEERLRDAPSWQTPPRIRTSDPATRAVLGYLLANCGTCHDGRGEIAALGPTLRVEDLLTDGDAAARALIGQTTRWQVPGVQDGDSVLIDLAAPERSALLVRMRSRSPSSQMPPLGTVLRDAAAVERVSAWVQAQRVSAGLR